MTKLKTKKKMNKSTIAIIIMAFIMVAMVAFGGTYAYFTATSASRASKFTVGKVALRSDATFTTVDKNVVPGDTVLNGSVSYINDSNVDTYIAVVFDVLYNGNYFFCTGASSGEGQGRTEATWEMRTTTRPLNLNAAQIREAFGDAFDISNNNTIIEKTKWVQGSYNDNDQDAIDDYDYRNIYLMGATNSFKVAAPIVTEDGPTKGDLKPVADRTTNFIKEGSTADILTSLNRKFEEFIVVDAQDAELDTKTVMSIPSKNGASEWAEGDVYLAWEEADITIQFTAYQIQTNWIGEDTNDDDKPENLDPTADFNTVWKAMQEKVGYTGEITYVADAEVTVDYTVVTADTIVNGTNEVNYVIG